MQIWITSTGSGAGRGIQEASLKQDEDVPISLLRIRPDQKVRLAHTGEEYT